MFIVLTAAARQFSFLFFTHVTVGIPNQFVTMRVKPPRKFLPFLDSHRFNSGFNLFHAHGLSLLTNTAFARQKNGTEADERIASASNSQSFLPVSRS